MAGHGSTGSIDILRKTLIVVLLIGAMLLLHRFAQPSEVFDPRGLLALGFVVLAAYTIGELAEVVALPHITGYLLAGLVLGPSMADILRENAGLRLPPPLDHGILSEAVVNQLGMLDALALALIALTAGGELDLGSLRKGIRQIVGVLAGQAVTIGVGIVLFLWIVVEALPGTMPALARLDTSGVLALGAVLAAISFATSPSATIAVINSTGSKGPMTTTVLSAVVLKDVLVVLGFAAATAVAVGLLGAEDATTFTESLGHIGLSLLLGVMLGGGIHLYLRYIGAELLLFLVAVIYTTTFVVQELHGEAALTFIVAGIVIGNFSDLGETLIHEVERLSLPVYVVFFTLAGAKLHLDELWIMLVPAVALFLVRGGAMFVGVRAGATLSGASQAVVRHGWMGFVSQAGLSIVLAGQTRDTFGPEIGGLMFSLILGGVALNEVFGPVMLQWGLTWAGEVGGPTKEEEAPETDKAGGLELWTGPPGDAADIWGEPLPTGADALDRAVEDLAHDLEALVRDQTWVPLADLRRDAEAWLRQLRREFLRISRRAAVRTGPPDELAADLRNDVGELGERWRDLVLDLAARAPRADRWSPRELVDAVDDHVSTLPESLQAPVHPSTLEPRPEPWTRALQRSWLRLRNRMSPVARAVGLRELARFHFSGEVPARFEGLAALLVNAELHLAARTNAMFAVAADGLEAAARAAESDGHAAAQESLELLRESMDTEFKLALGELEAIARDGLDRAARTLGAALQRLRQDARDLGTPDLPHRHRRFGRVFTERNRGLMLLGPGLKQARQVVSARLSQLALELELVGLEGRVRDVVSDESDRLARSLRGRGPKQLRLVEGALAEWLTDIRRLIEVPPGPQTLASRVRTESEALVRRIAEARGVVEGLSAQLADESWVNRTLNGLLQHAAGLTERYEVPTARTATGEWALPTPVPTAELDFRDVVGGFLEARVTRDLLDLSGELTARVQELVSALNEVERVVAFNVELACAELDVLDERTPAGPETLELVSAMLLGAVGRGHHRIGRLAGQAEEVASQADERVEQAVIGQFEALRSMILDGRLTELRTVWLRDAQLGRQIARRAEEWRGLLPAARDRAGHLLRRALGEDRLLALRASLGLPELGDERELHQAVQPPQPAAEVPVVYRRLFSEQALEAGDLLSGRQDDLERMKACLTRTGGLRSVAVVGLDQQAALALVSTALRSTNADVVRWEPEGPVTAEQVDTWFAELGDQGGRTVVLEALPWLFSRLPGGFAPLERLVTGIVDDAGRNAFVLVADAAVWRFAARVSGLREAMGSLVHLEPLTVEQLEQALLSRHAMSGYDVVFEADEDLGWQLEHVLLRGEDRERRRRRAWFRTLHAASAGVLQDALRLWMASIRAVDEETLRIGAVPRPPLTRLHQLPEDVLLTLLELTWQGWITPEQHCRLFRTAHGLSEAHLAQLAHVGLLVRDGDVMRLVPHLRGPLDRVLRWRGWA